MSIDALKKIIEEEALEKEYEYIWPMKDRAYCPKITLEKVLSVTDEGHDVIFLGVVNNGINNKNKVYYEPKEFYHEWGWLATSLDVTIFKKTFLDIDINKSKTFNKDYNQSWYTFVVLFFLLAQIENGNIYLLCDSETIIYNSMLGKSTWEENVFKIWKDDWIQANDNLPSCYDEYKNRVIKSATSLPWILGGIPRLLELHQKGILTREKIDIVIKNWERVSEIPCEIVKEIACGTYDMFHDMTSIKNMQNEIAILLVQMTKLLKSGKMKKEHMPYIDIKKCVENEIMSKNKYSVEVKNNVVGSINDVIDFAKKESTTKDELIKILQILTNFILLSQ